MKRLGKEDGAVYEEAVRLMKRAQEVRKNAYTPYSHFAVGAAILGTDENVYTGCNVENAAYSPGNCAERTAVFKAVSEGCKSFEAIAIVGAKEGEVPGGRNEEEPEVLGGRNEEELEAPGGRNEEELEVPGGRNEEEPEVPGGKKEDSKAPGVICSPCGVCRQVLREFCEEKDFRVYLTDGYQLFCYTLEELLPLSFGPNNL